ncbi:MAG: cation:proton antiporter, partial [Acidimicrobiales bacterium]
PLDDPASFFVVLFLAILAGPILARRARLPGIVGLVLVGVVIGPGGFGILARDGTMELLGGAGLLYLMFLGGLDLDRDGFDRERSGALTFSIMTTVFPLAATTAVGMAMGLDFLPAALLASALTSHTLVSYPLVQRFGLTENRASVIALGGTLVSTVIALLVLAVVAAAHTGTIGPVFWIGFVGGIAVFFVVTVRGLPRLASWFFTGLGQDRTVRYAFTLAGAFGAALLAAVLGIEPIVGAFVAGLALNRFVHGDALLMDRIQFLGSSLLVPVFLVSTGMLIDPFDLITDPESLVLGAALTAAAIGSKAIAVLPVALVSRLTPAESGLVIGLTTAQAAGALAAAIVALDIGLIGVTEINAVVVVILLTCVFAAALTERCAQVIPQPDHDIPAIGVKVVVPVINADLAPRLVAIAAALARVDKGVVVPLTVLAFDAGPREVRGLHDELTGYTESVALANGADLDALVRIDVTPSAGMLHTVIEGGASCILLGWKGFAARRTSAFGEDTDAILTLSPVPVLVCRPSDLEPSRVVLSVIDRDLAASARPTIQLGAEVAGRIAGHFAVPNVVVSRLPVDQLTAILGDRAEFVPDVRTSARALLDLTQPGDVVIVAVPPVRTGLGRRAVRLADALPDRTLLLVAGG